MANSPRSDFLLALISSYRAALVSGGVVVFGFCWRCVDFVGQVFTGMVRIWEGFAAINSRP